MARLFTHEIFFLKKPNLQAVGVLCEKNYIKTLVTRQYNNIYIFMFINIFFIGPIYIYIYQGNFFSPKKFKFNLLSHRSKKTTMRQFSRMWWNSLHVHWNWVRWKRRSLVMEIALKFRSVNSICDAHRNGFSFLFFIQK